VNELNAQLGALFVPDYKPTERSKYVEAYFKNLDWRTCEARLIK